MEWILFYEAARLNVRISCAFSKSGTLTGVVLLSLTRLVFIRVGFGCCFNRRLAHPPLHAEIGRSLRELYQNALEQSQQDPTSQCRALERP